MTQSTARRKKKLSFEEGMEQLEALTQRLGNGGLSLDESMKLYEEGVALSRQLEQILAEHRKKLEMIDPETGEITSFEENENELS